MEIALRYGLASHLVLCRFIISTLSKEKQVFLYGSAWQGLVVTGVAFYLQTWCLEKKGPVFLAIFTPLSLVFTLILSIVLAGEMVHLGR